MKAHLLPLLLLMGFLPMSANNIKISNVIMTSKSTAAGANNAANHILVQFDLSWENSWRTTSEPNNWDAAWVFIKYRVGNGAWAHAFLNNTGHTAATGSTIDAGLLTPGTAFNATTNPAIGVFVYRSAAGTGNNLFENIQLRWNYRANGVDDNAEIQVQVLAVEMVYVPSGTFWIGDGKSTTTTAPSLPGYFRTEITSSTTYPANNASCCGGNGTGNELAKMTGGGSTFPKADYPNGFNAFYAMKYPITQNGYVDFLNTLTRTQQANRHIGNAVGQYMAATSGQVTPLNRNGVRIVSTPAAGPWTYACDLNTSNSLPSGVNEEDDGNHIACNWLNFADVMAYLDWSGLRPITKMEFEKLGRGPSSTLVNDEMPWGGNLSSVTRVSNNLTNTGTSTEYITDANFNAATGWMGSNATEALRTGPNGPVRVGIFAANGTSKSSSGASYYGAMHLADNVHGLAINLTVDARSFTGSHGNGSTNAAGFHDAATWPFTNNTTQPTTANPGISITGSCWMHGTSVMPISRHVAVEPNNEGIDIPENFSRASFYGGRGVRSAP